MVSSDADECALEENPLEESWLEIEENPGDEPCHVGDDGGPTLEHEDAADSSSDDDDDWWEIPFLSKVVEKGPVTDEEVEVRLPVRAGERLGLVLDEHNVVVALRPGTPAAHSGEVMSGDMVLTVQGVACSRERRVAQLLRELPSAAVYVLTLRRKLDGAGYTDHLEHGPLLTPEETPEYERRELEARQRLREQVPAEQHEQLGLNPRNLAESKFMTPAVEEIDPIRRKHLQEMWYRSARDKLGRRLSAAEMLRSEGNDKFSEGKFVEALEEYEYALDLFKYEIANLVRDQEGAGLGDEGRGLGSDDLPAINKVRVPCLLNCAACHVRLGTREHLLKALDACRDVLQACPPAAQRAKAHFRTGQAEFGLENYREAWAALSAAQALNPSSREVRSLQAKVSYQLKQLKVAERESREGLMTTELNHKQLFKQQEESYASKLKMLRKLHPPAGAAADGGHDRAERLFEKVAAKGWTNLSGEEQLEFSRIWSAAQPRLTPTEVRDGRDASVYPPRDEERIFGQNLPTALMAKAYPPALGWLTAAQRDKARGFALTIWQRGAEDLDGDERRECEGLELLALSPTDAPWHAKPLGGGGAQLILAAARAHMWPFVPPTLRRVDAVMGASMARAELHEMNSWARRRMEPGELGILRSNEACWAHAVAAGWEWSLVLEDDAKVELPGGALQLLPLLPLIVASAAAADKEWQLICLTPWGLEPFYELCEPEHIPSLVGTKAPAWARKPKLIGETGWKRVGPTFHAFGWIYRRPLMEALLDGLQERSPPLNPLDVWVWEVMAEKDMLWRALAPTTPLVGTRTAPGGGDSLRMRSA